MKAKKKYVEKKADSDGSVLTSFNGQSLSKEVVVIYDLSQKQSTQINDIEINAQSKEQKGGQIQEGKKVIPNLNTINSKNVEMNDEKQGRSQGIKNGQGKNKKKYEPKVEVIKKQVIKQRKPKQSNPFTNFQQQSNEAQSIKHPECMQRNEKQKNKKLKKKYNQKPPMQSQSNQKRQIKKDSQSQSEQQLIQSQKHGKHKQNRSHCNMKDMIPQTDLKKFTRLCTNVNKQISQLEFYYSEKRPLLFCQFLQDGKLRVDYFGDIVHLNRVKNISVDIQLLWRTYDLFYKQVSEDFWGIAKFGMVRAEEKNKFWAKTINIYKHKQLLKLYYVIQKKQIHFLLLHKQFRRTQFSSSYIEQKKLQYPYEYRSYEKFKKFLQGKKQKQQFEIDQQIDSDIEIENKQGEQIQQDVYFYRQRLEEILDKKLDWLKQDLKNMVDELYDMNFGDKRTEMYEKSVQLEEMIKQFQNKQEQIKNLLKSKEKISDFQIKLLAKNLIIAEKQLQSKLPICLKKKQIFKLLKNQNVIILEGETGSGKSTQLPQILFEYYQIYKKPNTLPVLITQPRKIATRTLARRVADELEEKIHGIVDYQCTSTKGVNQKSKIIFKLDRLVLDQLTQDPLLSKYSCLVVDEAHERTISIDVILGRLKHILSKRNNFKLIITSASMNAKKFGDYFNAIPVKIPGRLYSVTTKYEPMINFKDTREKIEYFIKNHLLQKDLSKQKDQYYGHTLVFCPGIEDVQILVEKFRNLLDSRSFVVLALHSKLSSEKQRQIFKDQGRVKIIFTTKIAQTSITINGVKVVINPGIDRQVVYDHKTKVSSLQFKLISKSQAIQRAGRAGRTGPGFCFHLYSEQQEKLMSENKLPQMVTMPPDTVVLRLKALEIADIYKFPFLDAPKKQNLEISLKTLKFIGCLNMRQQITQIGKLVLLIPIEPFLSRSIIQSIFYSQALKQLQNQPVQTEHALPAWINNLKGIDLVGEVTKILCLIMNSQDLYLKQKQATKEEKADKQILIDYKMQYFEGQFDLLSTLYKDYQKNQNNRKLLRKWSQRNKISIKSLILAKQMHWQISQIVQWFRKNLVQIASFKKQVNKRSEILISLQSQKQVINSCLLTSLVNYLSLYSEVPELGYTMISQKIPVLLDQRCVMTKKNDKQYKKWAICFNIVVDQFNRVISKSAQPFQLSLIRKIVDDKLFDLLQMDKIDKFDPFYHKFHYQLPSIIFGKVVADYKKRNFDMELQFLCPYTFVFNEKNSSFTAYHWSNCQKDKLQFQLNQYVDKLRKPLLKPYKYNFSANSEITFNKDFKLASINKKDVFYAVEIQMSLELYQNKMQQITQCEYFEQKPTVRHKDITKINGVVGGQQNLTKLKQIIQQYQNQDENQDHQIVFRYEVLEISNSLNCYTQKQVFVQIEYVDAAQYFLFIQFEKCNKIKSKRFNQSSILRSLVQENIQGIKYLEVVSIQNQSIFHYEKFQNLKQTVYHPQQRYHDKAIVCYLHERQQLDEQKLRKVLSKIWYNFQITEIQDIQTYFLHLSNQGWLKKLKNVIQQDIQKSIYQQYNIEFVKRVSAIIKSHEKVKLKIEKDQFFQSPCLNVQYKKTIIQMKITSRSKHLIERIDFFSLCKRGQQNIAKNIQFLKLGLKIGDVGVSTRLYNHELVLCVSASIFETLETYFYENCGGDSKVHVIHKRSKNYQGVPTIQILLRYEQKRIIQRRMHDNIQIQKNKKTRLIKQIFTPKQIAIDPKYKIILQGYQKQQQSQSQNTCRKQKDFKDIFEEQHNYQVKLIFIQKQCKIQMYCQKDRRQELEAQLLGKLMKNTFFVKCISYEEMGLNRVLRVLEKSKCHRYIVDYDNKIINLSGDIGEISKVQKQLCNLLISNQKQCLICFEKFIEPYRLLNCNHSFCQLCLKSSIVSGQSRKKCPQLCEQTINVYDIQRLLTQQDFNKICNYQVKSQISKSNDYFFCYSSDCQQIKVLKEVAYNYSCNTCLKSYCMRCKQIAHPYMKCEGQLQEQQQLLKLGIRKCPKCWNGVEKSQGCNHMHCKCGAHFCWKCGQNFISSTLCYSHLKIKHGGIYDDQILNMQLNQLGQQPQINLNNIQARIGARLNYGGFGRQGYGGYRRFP